MSFHSQNASSSARYKLIARTQNITAIMRTLQVVNFREFATFHVTDSNIRVTVEEMRCVQSSAYITSLAFNEYTFNKDEEKDGDDFAFKINLNHVVTCLKVHSKSSASLKLAYRGNGFPLELLVEENGVVTDCNLKTFPPDDLLRFSLDQDAHCRITISCDLLKVAVREIDPTSDIVEISLSPDSPNFVIFTVGAGGEGLLEMDKTDGHFKTFDCGLSLKSSYKLNHLKVALKPLSSFQTCCLRLDQAGLLRLQYITNLPSMRHCIAEFFVMPLLE